VLLAHEALTLIKEWKPRSQKAIGSLRERDFQPLFVLNPE